MSDTTWTLTTLDYGDIVADAALAARPTFTIGAEVELTFLFHSSGHLSEYSDLLDHIEYLNDTTITHGSSMQGRPYYRQSINPNAPVSSYLVELKPGSGISEVDSYWAVMVGGSDETRLVGAGERVTVTFLLIAPLSQYSTRSDVQSAHEVDA